MKSNRRLRTSSAGYRVENAARKMLRVREHRSEHRIAAKENRGWVFAARENGTVK